MCYKSSVRKKRRLADAYRFPQFNPLQSVIGIFGDPKARVIKLTRRGKKQFAVSAARGITQSMTARSAWDGTSPVVTPASIWTQRHAVFSAKGAVRCNRRSC